MIPVQVLIKIPLGGGRGEGGYPPKRGGEGGVFVRGSVTELRKVKRGGHFGGLLD